MESNIIYEINDESLVGYGNLTVLDLSRNDISIVNSTAFAPTPVLKELYLCENNIDILRPGIFDTLHKLEKLDLSRNRISTIYGPSVFQVC